MTLVPAYGRDYTSAAKVRADWDANMDFIVSDVFHGAHGKPTNKADCAAMGDHCVTIRYAKMTKQVAVQS